MPLARRNRNLAPIEGDFTSMLDLIFNLLAFFVVTFNPPKPELNFDLTLPAPQQGSGESKNEDPFDITDELFRDVTIRLTASADGNLDEIVVEGQKVDGIAGLVQKILRVAGALGGLTGTDNASLESANIVADPKLKYVYVIQVVDACYQCNIRKINFGGQKTPAP